MEETKSAVVALSSVVKTLSMSVVRLSLVCSNDEAIVIGNGVDSNNAEENGVDA